ncbi:Formamidopyrimidine-DNA glycosylase [compost metagenome]
MPELPEVETIRRDLEDAVVGRRITGVFLYEPRVVRHPEPEAFVRGLKGKRILGAERRGKHLLIRLSGGWVWAIHLVLEGQLLYQEADEAIASRTKLAVQLDNGFQLRLRDVVDLARVALAPSADISAVLGLSKLGPEPLDPGFTVERFLERLTGRRGMIKPLLMNQEVLAGVGNLYADEALFRARIHPARKANTLGDAEKRRLYSEILAVLREGVAARGTSGKRGLYRDLWGQKGRYQEQLKVFRREGEPCRGCPGEVALIRIGGRATHYCPSCQLEVPVPATR